MSALTRPRGPLPARVYWTRRLLIIGTALALVVGIGSFLNRGSNATSANDTASRASSEISDSVTPGGDRSSKSKPPKKSRKPKKTPLAQPDGPCRADDIEVTPVVKDAVAGGPVRIRLKLQMKVTPACSWQVSDDTLTFKITSGADDIWSSRECPRAVRTRDVVLRQAKRVWMAVTWSAKRSDEDCSRLTEWALPGWYHLSVAALAGEPEEIQFQLKVPEPEVITQSPEPNKDKGKHKSGSAAPSDQPTGSPSGAVEPNG
jgi:hypothetical protein